MNDVWGKTKDVIKYTSPLVWLVIEGAEKASKSINEASKGKIKELEEEVFKQKLKMDFAQSQARVAQELAIAKRIENADEVEIEEFYDPSGKGNIGLDANSKAETVSFGVGGEGRKIAKRIYHFRGWKEQKEETFQQILSE